MIFVNTYAMWGWATLGGVSNRGAKAKTITSCNNAFVTNIILNRDPGASNTSEVAIGRPWETLLCAKVMRQSQKRQQ